MDRQTMHAIVVRLIEAPGSWLPPRSRSGRFAFDWGFNRGGYSNEYPIVVRAIEGPGFWLLPKISEVAVRWAYGSPGRHLGTTVACACC